MGVAVLGDHGQAWLVAAHASASSGEAVRLLDARFTRERVTLDVRYPDGLRRATIDLGSELRDADTCVIVAATELDRQRATLVGELARLAGRTVILAPGGAGGSIRASALFEAASMPVPPLAELCGFPVLGAMAGRTVSLTAVKRRLPIGVLDPTDAVRVAESLRAYLPDVVTAESILATSLANTNNVVHPPLAVVNAARIDAGLPFRFYREGLTPAGARLIAAVDGERLRVTDSLGLERVSIVQWFRRFYGDQGLAGDDIGTILGTFQPLAESLGPSSLQHRYLTDDVASGLAVVEAIGQRFGVQMPVTEAVCDVISTLVGGDLRAGAAETAAALLERGRTAPASSDFQRGALASAGSREGS
jgi:opine dehydrogenase